MGGSLKRVLMIAYHFPPLAGSSGIQRTLRFVQHLPELGWQPLVLTANPRSYENTSDDQLDTARHLSVGGRYFGWMARPDRWVSWKFAAIREGQRLIREFSPDVIWSTYPIATAHVIAASLHRQCGIPWVADFRDPMAQDRYPEDPNIRRSFIRIETEVANQAARCVFTTPGAALDYRRRYPGAAGRVVVIENGYDEESFAATDPVRARPDSSSDGKLILLHSGIVYPYERDPTQLFIALQRLSKSGAIHPEDLRIRFRAPVHDDMLQTLAAKHGVQDFIELRPAIPYREALAEMMTVDALLVMQASDCNAQIPAKIYEYLRAGRPIIGLTDPLGDTAGVMRGAGLDAIAPLDSADDIAALLPSFLAAARAAQARLPEAEAVRGASRKGRADFG
jgi:glycosyltransferase involved in cell wall biosynthesis